MTAFDDLESYIALPRLSGLVLSPDGTRLVTAVSTLDPKSTTYVTALWEVDPAGVSPARRLTRSAKGEGGAAFTPAGDLLFTSGRPDPESKDGDDEAPDLWLLPAAGGEARVVAHRKAGLGDLGVAKGAATLVVSSGVLPHAGDDEQDEQLRKDRKEKKVAAILHTGYPVRYWDHDLGPDEPHWFVGTLDAAAATAGTAEAKVALTDVTPDAGRALDEQHAALSPDGSTLVTGWTEPRARADQRVSLVAIDVATKQRRTLVSDEGYDVFGPSISPDGRWVVFHREFVAAPDRAPHIDLAIVPSAGGQVRPLTAGWDRWPDAVQWLPGSDGLLVVADDDGRAPVFLLSLDGTVTRVTSDDATFHHVQVAPDGRTAYALRSSYLSPAHPVAIDLTAALPVAAEPLPAPAPLPELPGRLEEIETTGLDGTRVRAWLALPHDASPDHKAPLLLWIHGGPLGSWNDWSWRWCPWLLVARGYAVLLPDPALSLGYGQDFVQRGWGQWGGNPFTDLMAATDKALTRDDVDPQRTAAMGGSFGGYMANWVAGHTDRFKAIVTHASLWALDQFGGTTDAAFYWRQEMTPQMALENSPHLHVGDIRTPMLVVHGDHDYRVPIGEGLRLWYELLSHSQLAADDEGRTPHRFLYFPDENHWVLTPQHAAIWYGTVFAFLAEHVLGDTVAEYPRLLG
ncbi:MAG TPA: alpha/beta fold hydrolase [Cellulomonas sp.]